MANETLKDSVVELAKSASIDVKEQAMQLLSSMIKTATQTGEFIKDQVPIVIKELLMYNTAIDIVGTVASFGFFIFGIIMITKLFKKACAESHDGYGVASGLLCIPTIISVIVFFHYLPDLLKITLAPRVWLIEYAAHLVK